MINLMNYFFQMSASIIQRRSGLKSWDKDNKIQAIKNRKETQHSNPANDRNIKPNRQLEQVFEPYRVVYIQEAEVDRRVQSHGFCKDKTLKFPGGGGRGGWNRKTGQKQK